MDAIPMRDAGASVMPAPRRRLRRLLSALAHAALERLTSAQRDVPPDFHRFPPL